jgi:hypothetical protein
VCQEEHQNYSEEGVERSSPLEDAPAENSEEIAQGVCESGLISSPKSQEE